MEEATRSRTSRRRKAAIAAATLAAALTAPPAQAFERVVLGVGHFIDCAGWLLSNPARHAANCTPNRVPPSFESISSIGGSAPLVVAPPAPPEEPDPIDPPECGPIDCGPSDCGPT